MEDELEKFIKGNRDQMNDDKPSEKVWNAIEEAIVTDKKKLIDLSIYWKAAAIVFFFISAFLLYRINTISSQNQINGDEMADSFIDEFYQTELYYLDQIESKMVLLEDNESSFNELTSNFKTDLQSLDQQYSELKLELSKNNNEQVINALILNLQMRMDLLSTQLEILNDVKKSKSDENTSI